MPIRVSRVVRAFVTLGLVIAVGVFAGVTRGDAQGFAAPVLVPTGNQPVFVATADVNGDGIPDLIYIDAGATPSASSTHVLLGDGKGGFKQSAVLQTAGSTLSIGNLLGSGKVDIAWISAQMTGDLQVLTATVAPGDGTGTYASTQTIASTSVSFAGSTIPPYTNLLAARLTKAGDVKTFYQFLGSFLSYLDANPNPAVAPQFDSANTSPFPGETGPLTVVDLNGDGFNDFVVASTSLHRADVLLNYSDSVMSPALPTYYTGSAGVYSLLVQDFNGDGIPDLAVEGSTGRIEILPGSGNGMFGASSIGGTQSPDDTKGDGGHLIAAADLNGDGIPDLLAFSPMGVSVELGTPGGNLDDAGSYQAGTGAGANGQFVTADFNGDGALDMAVDAPGGIAILYGKAASGSAACTAPAGTVAACPEPSAFEGAFTLTATVPGGASATGTVTFSIAGSQSYESQSASLGTAPVVNGVATMMVTGKPLGAGTPIIPGTYAVTGSYLAANSALAVNLPGTHTINLAPTTVTLTPAPPSSTLAPTYFYGQGVNGYVHFNTLDGAYPATGSWTQLSNGVPVPGCINLSVTAVGGSECPYGYPTLLDAGSYAFTEAYNGGPANGDPINASSVSTPYAFTVMPDTTTASALTSSLNPAPAGTAVTFTVTLTGNAAVPTGTVQLLDAGSLIGTGALNAAGQASFTTSALAVGTHPITAVYAATLDFQGVTSAVLSQVIQAVPATSFVSLTSSLNPSLVGQPVTFTAAASVPGPFPFLIQSGTMTFRDGTAVIGTGAINQYGRVTFTTAKLGMGSHLITASYPGGTSPGGEVIAPAVSPALTQVVDAGIRSAPPGFTLTVTPNPVVVKPGSTGVELVTVTAISGFSQAVTLSCTGTNSSNELGCGFLETTIPAGGGATTLDLVTTAPYACGGSPTKPYVKQASLAPSCGVGSSPGDKVQESGWRLVGVGGAMAAGLVWMWPRRRRRWARLLGLVMLAGVVGLSGCGNCTNLGTRPGNYEVTVIGTAGSMTQSVVLKLTVQVP